MASTITFGVRCVDADPATLGKQANSGDFEITDLAQVGATTSGHIQFNQLLAFIDGDSDGTVESAQNLSDMGYGNRVMSLEEGNANDAVIITAHGRQNNGTVGLLDGSAPVEGGGEADDGALTGAGFNNAWGFGVDNGPESGTRWLNDGDALGFRINQDGKGLAKVSFTANVRDSNGNDTQDAGDVADIYLDFDGTIIASGGYTAGQNAANLDFSIALKGVKHGQAVVIDFDLGTITVGGVMLTDAGIVAGQQGSIAAFFAAFNSGEQNAITIGGGPNRDAGAFSIQDLALETIAVAPEAIPDFEAGIPVLSLDSFSRPGGNPSPVPGELNNEQHIHAYLDADGDNVLDAGELPTIEKLSLNNTDSSGDGDPNPLQGDGNAGPRNDLLDFYFRGIKDTLAPSGHQYGDGRFQAKGADGGAFSLGIDSASPADVPTAGGPNGSPADVAPGTGNLGDESGGRFINTGEVVGVVLKSALAATALRIQYADATDLTPATASDIIVRLYQGDMLIETVTHDIANTDSLTPGNGAFVVADNFGQVFDRVEIQAAGSSTGVGVTDAGARFALTDLDFAISGLAAPSGPTLRAVHEANGTRLFVAGAPGGEFDPAAANGNNGPVVDVNGLIGLSAFNADGSAAQIRFDQGESIAVDGMGNADLAKRIDKGETLRIERLDGASTDATVTIRTTDAAAYGTGSEVKLILRNGDVVVGEAFFDLTDDLPAGGTEFDTLSVTSALAFDTIDVIANAAHAAFSVDEVFFM